MKQSSFQFVKEIFPGSKAVRRFTFKTMGAWDSCALLAVKHHQLAMTPAISRDKSVHFWNNDCFECLSPKMQGQIIGPRKTAA